MNKNENQKQATHYYHDTPSHNQKLREINKGVYKLPIDQINSNNECKDSKDIKHSEDKSDRFPYHSKGPYDKWEDINNTKQECQINDSKIENKPQTQYTKLDSANVIENKSNGCPAKNGNTENKMISEGKIPTTFDKSDKLGEIMVPDESATDKDKKDFEKVPSEEEKYNHKMNKKMNKEEEKRGIPDSRAGHPVNREKEEGIYEKTKEMISTGIEKAKEMISKF